MICTSAGTQECILEAALQGTWKGGEPPSHPTGQYSKVTALISRKTLLPALKDYQGALKPWGFHTLLLVRGFLLGVFSTHLKTNLSPRASCLFHKDL